MDYSKIPRLYVVNNFFDVCMIYTSRDKAEEAVRILKERHSSNEEESEHYYFVEILEGQAFGDELAINSECIFFCGDAAADVKMIKELPELNDFPRQIR